MPEMDGLACLDRIMLEHPCPVVMVSSLTEAGADVTLEALELGAVDFVPKPDGAISLRMDTLGPLLVEKVRTAAAARLPAARAWPNGCGSPRGAGAHRQSRREPAHAARAAGG